MFDFLKYLNPLYWIDQILEFFSPSQPEVEKEEDTVDPTDDEGFSEDEQE